MATLKEQLANIQKQYSSGSGSLANGKNIKAILKEEGEKLYNMVQEEIDNMYSSYSPVEYERSYRFKQALRIDPVKQEGNTLSVKIYFDRGLSMHPSYVNDTDDGDVSILLNYGWSWGDTSKAPYRFSQYSPEYHGTDFINRAIRRYNATNTYGFKLNVHAEWDGTVIEDSTY